VIERKAYICEHCNFRRPIKKHVYLSKDAAESHERTCYYNPLIKSCFTCNHNEYVGKRNVCSIDKNYKFKDCVKYCKEHSLGDPKEEFSNWPVTMQVVRYCKHWTDESEGKMLKTTKKKE
jgi:hypothetical protein